MVAAGLVAAFVVGVVGLWLHQWVDAYGWHPSAWVRGWLFAHGWREIQLEPGGKLKWRPGLGSPLVWYRRRSLWSFGTRLYTGLPGSGKTLLAVRDGILLMRRGVRVVSNLRIVDPLSGRCSDTIKSQDEWLALAVAAAIKKRPTVFIIDEIHTWADARNFKQTPRWWLWLIAQHRHLQVGIIGTAQHANQVEIALRRLCALLIMVRPVVPRWLPFLRRLPWIWTLTMPMALVGDKGEIPPGAGHRAFRVVPWWVYGGYNTQELVAFEEWNDSTDKAAAVKALTRAAQDAVQVPKYDWVGGEVLPEHIEEADFDLLLHDLLNAMSDADRAVIEDL